MGMDLRLVAYAPNGASLGVLPAPSGFSGSLVLSDVGALTLEYAADAPRAALLAGACEVGLEYVTSVEILDEVSDYTDVYLDAYPAVTTVVVTPAGAWTEPLDCRFVVLRDSGDDVKRPGIVSYEAPGIGWRLSKAIVLPDGLRPDGKRAFTNATPGTILRTLLNEATGRLALAGMDFTSFTTSLDSNGAAWTHTITIYYTPGIDLLKVLRNLADQGMCDYAFQGRSLQVWNPDGVRARDLTAAPSQVELARARDLQEAPYSGTREGISSWAFLQGDGDVSISVGNSEAEQPWGRWEDFVASGGVRDFGTLVALAQAHMARSERRREQRTYGLAFDKARHLPFRDYVCGDYVWARTGGTPVKVRVRQLTLGRTATGVVTGSAVLNDRFLEADVRLARRIDGITNGGSSGGTGGQVEPPDPNTGDTLAPAAPTGLNSSSLAYLEPGGAARAQVTLGWSLVTQNIDLTAADDVASYEVWQAPDGFSWRVLSTVDHPDGTLSASPYDVGSLWRFRVRAIDTSGNRGPFSLVVAQTMAFDSTPPAPPSTPVLVTRLGTVTVRWDGKNDVGGGPPGDLSHIEVHVSLSSGFTPSPATYAGRMGRGADSFVLTNLGYNILYYVKLIAADFSGNVSAPSAQASVTVQPLVNTDLIGAIINGANIVPGSVNANDSIIGNTITGRLIQSIAIEAGHLAANSVTTPAIAAGSVVTASLAADAVTADNVRVGALPPSVLNNGLSGNLAPDPGFEDVQWRAERVAQNDLARPGSVLTFTQTALDGNTTWRAQLVSRSGTGIPPAIYAVNPLSVTPERRLYGGFRVAEQTAANGAVVMSAQFTFPTGPTVTSTVATTTGLTTDDGLWHYATGTVEVPANAVSAVVFITCGSAWTTGVWTVDDIEVRDVIGAPGQQRRVEISPTGFYAYDPLPGEEIAGQQPVIALGTGSDDFLVLTDKLHNTIASISRDGFASFTDGSFNAWPTVEGRNLDDIIDARERGLTGGEWSRLSNSSPATNTEQGMVELGAFVTPGRMYRIHTSPIRLLGQSTGDHQAGIRLRWTFTNSGGTATASRPLLTSPPIGEALTGKFDGLTGQSVTINRIVNFNQARHIRMLLSVFMATGPSPVFIYGNDSNWPVEWWIEDMGLYKPPTGAVSDGSPASPPPIVGGTFERQFVSTWAQTFRGDGTLRTDTLDVGQGYHSSNGDQSALIGFPTITAELAGTTVHQVMLYLYSHHWHYDSGGMAIIGSHNNITPPGAFTGALTNRQGVTFGGKSGGKWIDITAWASVGVKDGTIRGISLGPASSGDQTFYGRFDGVTQPNPPILFVKYTK